MVDAPARHHIAELERQCAALLAAAYPVGTALQFDRPADPGFGELSCNMAMRLSRTLRKAARPWIAEEIVAAIDLGGSDLVERAEAVKGFVNFHARPAAFARLTVAAVRAHGAVLRGAAGRCSAAGC